MAFGDHKGSLTGSGASTTNPSNATGSVAVSVGDLIVAVMGEQTTNTVSAVNDNLGNVYSAQNPGSDAGSQGGRAFYSRVTVAGTLTTVSFTATASASDFSAAASVFEGPFAVSPLDANPSNITTDAASPLDCPPTGVLAQANELVVGWLTMDANSTTFAATSPMTKYANPNVGRSSTCIGAYTVVATTTTTPQWTYGGTVNNNVLGTMSFKRAAAVAPPPRNRPLRIWQRRI